MSEPKVGFEASKRKDISFADVVAAIRKGEALPHPRLLVKKPTIFQETLDVIAAAPPEQKAEMRTLVRRYIHEFETAGRAEKAVVGKILYRIQQGAIPLSLAGGAANSLARGNFSEFDMAFMLALLITLSSAVPIGGLRLARSRWQGYEEAKTRLLNALSDEAWGIQSPDKEAI